MSDSRRHPNGDSPRTVKSRARPLEGGGNRETAVALKYDGQGAPRVTAKGRGVVAEKILEIAEAHDIPLYQDHELAALLAQVEPWQEIPTALYVAVAEVLVFAYALNGKGAETMHRNPPSAPAVPDDGSL